MTWIDNDGGFKAHRKHWVNKSRREGEEGRGRRREEGVKGKKGGGRMEAEGRKGGDEEGVARRRYKALATFSAVRF